MSSIKPSSGSGGNSGGSTILPSDALRDILSLQFAPVPIIIGHLAPQTRSWYVAMTPVTTVTISSSSSKTTITSKPSKKMNASSSSLPKHGSSSSSPPPILLNDTDLKVSSKSSSRADKSGQKRSTTKPSKSFWGQKDTPKTSTDVLDPKKDDTHDNVNNDDDEYTFTYDDEKRAAERRRLKQAEKAAALVAARAARHKKNEGNNINDEKSHASSVSATPSLPIITQPGNGETKSVDTTLPISGPSASSSSASVTTPTPTAARATTTTKYRYGTVAYGVRNGRLLPVILIHRVFSFLRLPGIYQSLLT
jgi:hypothetical protein